MYEIHNFNRKIIPFDTISFNWISFLHLTILYTSQSNENSVYSSSSFTNNNKKLGILQKYIFHRSSLFFYDNTIFHLLIASKITPKKYWYYFYIFIGIFFQSAIKNLHWTVILLRVPSYYPTFSPTTIIYEHIHAIVLLLSVYLQFSIHFNLWFGVIEHWRCFLLLKMSNNENRIVTTIFSFLQNDIFKQP